LRPEVTLEIKQVAACLLIVAVALIVVGATKDALAPQVVEVVPLVLVFGLIPRWPSLGAWAAAGALGVWFALMALIWAYLLGLSDFASGTYTNFEVFLTIVVAGCSAHAVQKAAQGARGLPLWKKALAVAGGLAVQGAFLTASMALFP
jgi:hypothetical protein